MADRTHLIADLTDKLGLAAFDRVEWLGALKLLAQATGSSHAQMIGWIDPSEVPFSHCSDEPTEGFRLWMEAGGADPNKNPIIKAGMQTAALTVKSDDQIISKSARNRHPMWREVYDKIDIPHICFTPLWQDHSTHLMLTVLRSAREGVISETERRVFATAARQWQGAAMVSRALKNEGARVLRGAFEALSIPAIVLNGFGIVVSLSPAAETMVRDGSVLRIRKGRLEVASDDNIKLRRAVYECAVRGSDATPAMSMRVHGRRAASLNVRISALPQSASDIGFGASVIVLIETANTAPGVQLRPELADILTKAEAEIAIALLGGEHPNGIAKRRQVSIETVRTQIKSLYAKAEVSGRGEFMARARWQ